MQNLIISVVIKIISYTQRKTYYFTLLELDVYSNKINKVWYVEIDNYVSGIINLRDKPIS